MILRTLHVLIALLMLAFIAVQYNDPDALVWVSLYLVPAAANLCCAIRPHWVRSWIGRILIGLGTVLMLLYMLAWWPDTPNWWQREVWWNTETAREGMGLMIAVLAMVPALVQILPRRRRDAMGEA